MIAFIFVVTLVGVVIMYLTHPHQIWFKTELPKNPWRAIAAVVIVAGLVFGLNVLETNAAIFTWLIVQMLSFGALPFVAIFFGLKGEKKYDNKK